LVQEYKSFDRVADIYDATRRIPPAGEEQIAKGLSAVLAGNGVGPTVLEVGIGTGRIALPLAAQGVRITGIDIAPRMLAQLRGKGASLALLLAEASQPPFRPASFDAALFVHVLHLVPDQEATLRATIPLVRPGGLVISGGEDSEPNVHRQTNRVMMAAARELLGEDYPIPLPRWGSYEDPRLVLRRVLEAAGAEVTEHPLATWTDEMTGAEMVRRVREKVHSQTWWLPDEIVPQLADRVEAGLRELLGDLDNPVEERVRFSVTAGRLPA
jgi:ubiquinone/menaquinone biosynthesis C-methylase UbiE